MRPGDAHQERFEAAFKRPFRKTNDAAAGRRGRAGDQREISGGVEAIAGNASGNSQPDFRVFNAHEINEIKGL